MKSEEEKNGRGLLTGEGDRAISVNRLIIDILDSPKIETETVPKLLRLILRQPTVPGTQVSLSKRGRWEQHSAKQWSGGGLTQCSCCGTGYAWSAFFEVESFNYCPNCGAQMGAER